MTLTLSQPLGCQATLWGLTPYCFGLLSPLHNCPLKAFNTAYRSGNRVQTGPTSLHRYQKSHGHLLFLDFKGNLSQHWCHWGCVHTLLTQGSKHKSNYISWWHQQDGLQRKVKTAQSLMKRKQSQNDLIGEVNCSSTVCTLTMTSTHGPWTHLP